MGVDQGGRGREGGDGVKGEPLDLGHDHWLTFTMWAPDRELNPRYADLPVVERYGALVEHIRPDGEPCIGSVTFASLVSGRIEPGRPKWHVTSWEPLTMTPSLLCSCGDHGFVRDGRWVVA